MVAGHLVALWNFLEGAVQRRQWAAVASQPRPPVREDVAEAPSRLWCPLPLGGAGQFLGLKHEVSFRVGRAPRVSLGL